MEMSFLISIHFHNIGGIFVHRLRAPLMRVLLDTIGGIWAVKFGHSVEVTNFVVRPLLLLLGTIYFIERQTKVA
jgi:hypothetical protein